MANEDTCWTYGWKMLNVKICRGGGIIHDIFDILFFVIHSKLIGLILTQKKALWSIMLYSWIMRCLTNMSCWPRDYIMGPHLITPGPLNLPFYYPEPKLYWSTPDRKELSFKGSNLALLFAHRKILCDFTEKVKGSSWPCSLLWSLRTVCWYILYS